MRPWLALKHAGADFEEVLVPLDQPDTASTLARISPSARVPVLVHGETRLWESLAICEYAAELFPQAQLWPADRRVRAIARAVSNEMHAGFGALRQALSMNIRKRLPRPRTPEVEKDLARITQLWRDCRAAHGAGGPFLFGAFTIADAMYAPVVTRFRTYGVKLDSDSDAYCNAVLALPAMKEWIDAAKHEPWLIQAYELE